MASTQDSAVRAKMLMKEAYALSVELAKMDKKIEADLSKENSKFAEWIESNSVAKWLVEKAVSTGRDKALEEIIGAICNLLKIGTKGVGLFVSIGTSMFEADDKKQPSKKQAYLDTRPALDDKYYKTKERLQAIFAELLLLRPPTAIDINANVCATERCWRAR